MPWPKGVEHSDETREKISSATKSTRAGAANPAWKGGRTIDTAGYVLIKDRANPMAGKNGYVREHRLVMSRIVGRPLSRSEHVHHINGVKTDNRPENLELVTPGQHQHYHHLGAEFTPERRKKIGDAQRAHFDRIGRKTRPCHHCGTDYWPRSRRETTTAYGYCSNGCSKAARHARGWHSPEVGAKISATKRAKAASRNEH